MTSPPLADTSRRDWLSFDHDGDTYMFDVSFLTSNWTCIFGQGCKGVHETDTTELSHGCCSFGSHFADAADRKRVSAAARRLTADHWQHLDVAADLGGAFVKNDDGDWTTHVVDDACIFLNRNDFHLGAGCALHVGAMESGERPMDWKPEVCWQVPIRYHFETDELGHTTFVLREWKRRDWGDGGAEFHWWCTEAADAFIGHERVVDTLADEIRELVGAAVFDRLRAHIDDRAVGTVHLPHPAVRQPR
ncbi:MAG: hypothetical protein ACKOYM_08030 [Actinomycetes bacterium]